MLVHLLLMAATLCSVIAVSARTIRADVESRIASGELQPGDRLPAVRSLAADLGVAASTVAAAYRDLRQRGMVTGRGRQGTRVAPARRIEPTTTTEVPSNLLDAMNGSPDPALLPSLGPALAVAASLPQPVYGGPLVEPTLAAVADRLFAADGIDSTNLAVTSGAMDAVERVLHALDLRIGDRIGVEDPGHIPVHQIARSMGLELVGLPVDDAGITVEGLDDALRLGLGAVIVTPRAQNPTGAALTSARAEALTDLLARHPSTAVIQDDHAGLIAGADHHGLRPPGPRWAVMRSLGKSLGPDMRVALVVGDERTMHRVATGIGNGPGWVSFLLQRVAAHLLDDPDTRTLLSDATAEYERRRNRLIALLAEHGVTGHGASGLNVWIPTTRVQQSIDAARRAGYAIRSGAPYRLSSGPAVRVTTSNLGDRDIERVAEAIGDAHRSRPAAASV